MTTTATPAQLYLAGLSSGSQGMRQSLDIIAGILNDDHDAETLIIVFIQYIINNWLHTCKPDEHQK